MKKNNFMLFLVLNTFGFDQKKKNIISLLGVPFCLPPCFIPVVFAILFNTIVV
tara:strand:+ start:3801 stop:3959 length:159 start_codon:yes stop_codon:yes gene_type:complete